MSEKEYIFVGTAQLKTRDYIKSLEKENRDLQQKIDKAIDYITTEQLYTNYQWGKSQYEKILKDLLEILRDKE